MMVLTLLTAQAQALRSSLWTASRLATWRTGSGRNASRYGTARLPSSTRWRDDGIQASDLGTLQEVWSGGADCRDRSARHSRSKFRVQIEGTYGQTEAPTVITIEVPGVVHAPGSSGIPLPHLEVTIRDPDGRNASIDRRDLCRVTGSCRSTATADRRLERRRRDLADPPAISRCSDTGTGPTVEEQQSCAVMFSTLAMSAQWTRTTT